MLKDKVLRYISSLEKLTAMAQGKGSGVSNTKEEIRSVLKLLQGNLVIDIGANVGEYSSELNKYYPDLEIHIFEPSSLNFEKLMKRFSSNDNVKINKFAISDQAREELLFFDNPGSGLASLNKRKLDHFGISFDKTEKVHTITFEEYWKEVLASRQVSLAKLDIEGHELAALRGFGEALPNTKLVQFEFGGCNIDSRTYFQDFWYLFKEFDFKLFRISPFGLIEIPKYSETDEHFLTTNYIAVNNRL